MRTVRGYSKTLKAAYFTRHRRRRTSHSQYVLLWCPLGDAAPIACPLSSSHLNFNLKVCFDRLSPLPGLESPLSSSTNRSSQTGNCCNLLALFGMPCLLVHLPVVTEKHLFRIVVLAVKNHFFSEFQSYCRTRRWILPSCHATSQRDERGNQAPVAERKLLPQSSSFQRTQ